MFGVRSLPDGHRLLVIGAWTRMRCPHALDAAVIEVAGHDTGEQGHTAFDAMPRVLPIERPTTQRVRTDHDRYSLPRNIAQPFRICTRSKANGPSPGL